MSERSKAMDKYPTDYSVNSPLGQVPMKLLFGGEIELRPTPKYLRIRIGDEDVWLTSEEVNDLAALLMGLADDL